MNEKWDEIQGKLYLPRDRGKFKLSEFEISRFYSTNKSKKKKKTVKLIMQTSFAEKFKLKKA